MAQQRVEPVTDFYLVDELLNDEDRAVRDRVREFCDREVVPIINEYWQREEFPFELVPKIAELGIAGGTIQGYGCAELSVLATALVSLEWARADGSVGTFFGVHSGLAMGAIYRFGSDEHRERWLPPMARFEKLGAFALTEPDHGSDVVSLETRAHRDGDEFVLDGRKRWIGNGSIADVIVVWARDDDGHVGGYLVETDTPGFRAETMRGKASLRAVWQADIELQGVRVPVENRLPGCRTFRDLAEDLTRARYNVAWRALGVGLAAYEAALAYAKEREQFGRPIASFQLVQEKLSKMLAELTSMQLLCLRVTRLVETDRLTAGMASLAKMHTAQKAREIVAHARDIMGGNGILLEYHVARHHADMEAVFTFEGTDNIQSLIVGREVTGINAIAPE